MKDAPKLQSLMKKAGLKESDLQEHYTLGSGSGGQKINKTASCVNLLHLPSGLRVKCQAYRTREANRKRARTLLSMKLIRHQEELEAKQKKAIAKKRAQNRKLSAAEKQRRYESKKHRSAVKQLRQRPQRDD